MVRARLGSEGEEVISKFMGALQTSKAYAEIANIPVSVESYQRFPLIAYSAASCSLDLCSLAADDALDDDRCVCVARAPVPEEPE